MDRIEAGEVRGSVRHARAALVSAAAVLLGAGLARPARAQGPASPSPAPGPPAQEIEDCLSCHEDRSLAIELPGGERRSLFVDRQALAGSVHGRDLRCTDCHPTMSEVPHPPRDHRTSGEFRAGFRDACKGCHFENYRRSLDGVHQRLVARGDVHGPSCVECHGSHGIARPDRPRSAISRTCASCHKGISDAYVASVHGKALVETENADVPVCTDCHRAHDIADPRSDTWLLKTPELCGKCHTDPKVMGRYGLSTSVLKTYLADFHGMTASLHRGNGESGSGPVTALCIDCHGVHDITPVKQPGSGVLKANLVKTCRKCHPGATENFPAAWLSHYEPTWNKAPLVHGVKVFYQLFIPFVIGGLVLQILLHLWRVVVNR